MLGVWSALALPSLLAGFAYVNPEIAKPTNGFLWVILGLAIAALWLLPFVNGVVLAFQVMMKLDSVFLGILAGLAGGATVYFLSFSFAYLMAGVYHYP